MTNEQARREELMGAALAGELTEAERREFDRACAADPRLRREYQALQGVAERLDRSELVWTDQDLPPGLAGRVFAATTEKPERAGDGHGVPAARHATDGDHVPPPTSHRHRRRRVALMSTAAAASLLVVGALGGIAINNALQAPPGGPPGTLGAVEDVDFSRVQQGASFDASLVAHTWGTETVLEVDGLTVGDSYEVVLVSEDGRDLTSGTFFGSEQTVTCRMNAAVMREDVSALEIRRVTGEVVASSTLPDL
ncbi:hypothetical protein BJ994_000886 [Arthrobacter pigmenti]|uniref:Anti-sigma factor n=1 Tax=Arthrobacter pigmenti TaxID=271432 RepID=A0A846RJH0_9MICC|nr:hypothetical protein [Arthrobacter pigmenti]NJC21810.1 hypothetical protein [Arthrobacter pigmenti]